MLKYALQSLSKLKIPEQTDLCFLVVENDDSPQYAPLISEMQTQMNLHYAHEPLAGLTNARNKALDTVNALGVSWMGSVDDDQFIDPYWLVHMVTAVREYPDTAMFVGLWLRTDPPETPKWLPNVNRPKTKKTGSKLIDGVGGNSMIRSDVFSPNGMALRYDPAFQFLGGEDTDFSMAYIKKGGIIRHVLEAITTEEIPAERNNLEARLARITWMQSVLAKLRHKHYPLPKALILNFQVAYQGSVLGAVNLVLAALLFPLAENWALRRYSTGRRFWARFLGILRYYFGELDEPYRTTTGH